MGASKARLFADELTADTAAIDDRTGVWNRTGFLALATPTIASCEQPSAPVALAYFDLHFGAAPVTDDTDTITQALTTMARQLRQHLRSP